jgi:hypothetical protein
MQGPYSLYQRQLHLRGFLVQQDMEVQNAGVCNRERSRKPSLRSILVLYSTCSVGECDEISQSAFRTIRHHYTEYRYWDAAREPRSASASTRLPAVSASKSTRRNATPPRPEATSTSRVASSLRRCKGETE